MKGKAPKELVKRRKGQPPKDKPAKDKPEALPKESHWKDPNIAIGVGCLILGVVGSIPVIWAFQAGPTVSLQAPLNDSDVLTTRFVIGNTGPLDLENVRVDSFDEEVVYEPGLFVRKNVGLSIPLSSTLSENHKLTVPFHDLIKSIEPIRSADIGLIVRFTPQFFPWFRRAKEFRFKTIVQSDGKLRLEEQPVGELLDDYNKVKNAP
jgi:hypothetical protein